MEAHINAFGGTNPIPKKRVLFIITQSELGGAQQFILQFISQAQKDAYEFIVAIGADGNRSLADMLVAMNIRVINLPSLRRNVNPIQDLFAINEIKNTIKKTSPDTLFLISSKAGFIGSLAAKWCGLKPKVIYRIGGWSFNDPVSGWQKKFRFLLEFISAPWKDIIIVNNAHDLSQAKKMSIRPRDKVVMIHNGLDPYKINFFSKEEARIKLGLPLPQKVIGTQANFYQTKGLEYLIDAASKIDQENLIWCIIGDGAERPALEKLIAQKGLTDKVFLVGRREPAVSYFEAFDIYLMPSVKEGFPWAILEAMAAKLPIVATKVGAIEEILEDGVSGYIIEPRDPNQIVEKVATLLDNELRAKEMGIQAHQRLLFAFNVDGTIRQVEKLL